MMRTTVRLTLSLFAFTLAAQAPAFAQQSSRTIGPVCIACRNAIGIRFNIRDKDLERVVGINITVLPPKRPTTGTVNGLALGLLSTGGAYLNGFAVAPISWNAATKFQGIGVSGLAWGVGGAATGILIAGGGGGISEDMTGIAIAGLGMGISGNAKGILLAGIGGNVSKDFRGIAAAGLGFGMSGSSYGAVVSGLGAAVSGTMHGISLAGIGFGGSGSMYGITVAGMGMGVGQNVAGITASGLALGVGGSAKGLTVAGLGVSAGRLDHLGAAAVVSAGETHAVVLAPLYFRGKKSSGDASITGLTISAINDVRGAQHGIAIGVLNYARSLKGVQVGVLNIVADGKGPKILPLINWR